MADATNLTDIQTVIVNVSGVSRRFGFIPPHGKLLAANGSVTLSGDIQSYWPRATQKRWSQALSNAITAGTIEIRRQRRMIFYGKVTNAGAVGTITAGMLVYWDSGAGSIRPITDIAAGGSLTATRQSLANIFLGVALSGHANLAATVTNFPVDISSDSLYEFDCTSETHELGELLTPTGNAGTFVITSATTLVKTVTATEAIARVARRDTSAAVKVMVQLQSAFSGFNSAASL
jgi:hypothetical protein